MTMRCDGRRFDGGANARRELRRRIDRDGRAQFEVEAVNQPALFVEQRFASRAAGEMRARIDRQVRAAGVIDYGRAVSFTRHWSL